MIKNFVIPSNKDELLSNSSSEYYYVEEVVPLRDLSHKIDVTRKAIDNDGLYFILDHFDTFFSVIVHGTKAELRIFFRAFNRLTKCVELLIYEFEKNFDDNSTIERDMQKKLLCISNMLAYLLSSYITHVEEVINKSSIHKTTKKKTKSDEEVEWEDMKYRAVELIYQWLQLPIQKLWLPQFVEISFVDSISLICYKILEKSTVSKSKQNDLIIFDVLAILVKKYNHGMIFVVRIVQLVKLYDGLSSSAAAGIVHMIKKFECTGLIKKILTEIEHDEVTDSNNVPLFIESIATLEPELMYPIIDLVIDHLLDEFYGMRNGMLGVLKAVISKLLTGENLSEEKKEKRDECLDCLEEHLRDCNAYVRSKVLQIWQTLCAEGAIPLARQKHLLSTVTNTLKDKSAIVRKQAIQLIRDLLTSNPYAAKLNTSEFKRSYEIENEKFLKLRVAFVEKSKSKDPERMKLWNTLLPKVKETTKNVLKNYDKTNLKEDENVNLDMVFEEIRNSLLTEKIEQAVLKLWSICEKLKDLLDTDSNDGIVTEECLILLLLKIFLESENEITRNEINDVEKSDARTSTEKELFLAQERVMLYLDGCLKFAEELENSLPTFEQLLFSINPSDVIETCLFLSTAYKFRIPGSANLVQKALLQVLNRDQSVRNAVANMYKELFLGSDEQNKSERQRGLIRANGLIKLLKDLQPGQSTALSALLSNWYTNEEICNETLQVLLEIFTMKIADTSQKRSRAALMLIGMICQSEPSIVKNNFNVFLTIGLGERANNDLLLARDTCRVLLKLQNTNKINVPQRYPNDHELFNKIFTLLEDNFDTKVENGYISFATDAIHVVYNLADNPDSLIKQFIEKVTSKIDLTNSHSNSKIKISSHLLARIIYLIGHIAIRHFVYLDTSVYKEIKRRNMITNRSKNNISASKHSVKLNSMSRSFDKSININNEETGEEMQGAADDTDAEFINATLESEIVTGDGLLAQFVPLILEICKYPNIYNDQDLQASTVLTLTKMMTVSSIFCEESLQLLITILERSKNPGIRANILMGLNDLTIRFPNQVEPWTKHIYGRLRDEDQNVRVTCVRMLANLIMREMIRVKGQVSELALCIVDNNKTVQDETRQLFQTLSLKDNALYNVMPDIISRLTDQSSNLEENNFKEIVEFILNLIHKEKQIDSIIEKICVRFQLANTERQWRDLAYCLSLLQFNVKSIRRLIDSLPMLKDKIHHKEVSKTLQNIIEQTKKKPEAKAACTELEEKIQELLKGVNNNKDTNVPDTNEIEKFPTPAVKRTRKHKKKKSEDNSEEEELSEDHSPNKSQLSSSSDNQSTRATRRRKHAATQSTSESINQIKARKSSDTRSPSIKKLKSSKSNDESMYRKSTRLRIRNTNK